MDCNFIVPNDVNGYTCENCKQWFDSFCTYMVHWCMDAGISTPSKPREKLPPFATIKSNVNRPALQLKNQTHIEYERDAETASVFSTPFLDSNLGQRNKCEEFVGNYSSFTNESPKSFNQNEQRENRMNTEPVSVSVTAICNDQHNELNSNIQSKHAPKTHRTSQADEKPFKCQHCGKSFKFQSQLKGHMVCHDDERPFTCEQCNKSFKLKNVLKRHMVSHNDERPFKCQQCKKSFKLNKDLRKHMVCHDEKPFTCEQCNKSFKLKNVLKQHMVSHNDERAFKCQQCNKSFKLNKDLRKHMVCHNDEKPFTCERCNKAFKLNCHLKQHMVSHNDERPFKCQQCNKSFKENGNLRKHIVRHDNERPIRC